MLGFAPEDCVVVEDAPAGIQSGKSAGARVIAFRTTAPEDELRRVGADWVLANSSEISLDEPKIHNGKLALLLHPRS